MMWNFRRPPDPFISLSQTLKDLYGFYLEPKDAAKFELIERYWKILPYRYIREYNRLRLKGTDQGAERLRDFFYKPNPFLSMIPKDEGFQGKYYPIPIIYGKKDE